MRENLAPLERRMWNRLTVIKLALQMLERTTPLSSDQRRLVRAALEAIDGLIGELLDQRRAERVGAMVGRPAVGDAEPATLRRARGDGALGAAVERRWRFAPQPAAAVAMLAGVVLLVLVVVGAGVLLPLLSVLLLVGTVVWLLRR